MDRVSTSGIYNALVGNLMTAQGNQITAANQVSSQKVATDLKGFGAQSETLTAMQTVQSQTQSFLDQSNVTAAKLASQDSALGEVATASSTAGTAISSALASGSGTALMQAVGTAFQNAVSGLNTTYNGQYLFAGGQVNTPPVSATQLTDLSAPATVAGVFTNDSYVASTQLNQNTTIQTGFLASQTGSSLFNAFQSIQSYVDTNGPFSSPLTTAQTTFLQGALSSFQSASTDLTATQAQNGLLQSQVTNAQTDLNSQSTTMQGLIGNITDANLAQADTNLQQAQLAVQASAQVIASLKASSLVTLLPVS